MQHIITFIKTRTKLSVSTLATIMVAVVYGVEILIFIKDLLEVQTIMGVSVKKVLLSSLTFLAAIPFLFFVRDEMKYAMLWGVFLILVLTESLAFVILQDISERTSTTYDQIESEYEEQRREWK